MVFGRKGLFGNLGAGASKRVPFEPQGSVKFVRNPVPRGQGPIPLDDIVGAIRQSERQVGREALTSLECWILEAYNLEAYAIHQGGFDYYLAHVEGAARWADATAALFAMKREAACAVMRQAVELFLTNDHDASDPNSMAAYLRQMKGIDRAFAEMMPDFENALAIFADQHYPYADRI